MRSRRRSQAFVFMSEDGETAPRISWIAKAALLTSGGLAAAWFISSGPTHRAPQNSVAQQSPQVENDHMPEVDTHGSGVRAQIRHRGLARSELRHARQQQQQQQQRHLDMRSKEIREAATDPTSMFDMSTP